MFEQRPKKPPSMDMGKFKPISPPVARFGPEKAVLPEKNNSPRRKIMKNSVIAIVILVLVVLSGTTIYFYRQWKEIKTSPQVSAQKEANLIIGKISRFMDLPTGEEPTLATVTNVEKLKDQPFFANAQNGDKALVYSKAGKAILYRPSTNRIIEVISLSSGGQGNQLPDNQNSQEPQQPAVPEQVSP
jgi:hypothetical protein